jgi:GAF domain-containing protein
LYFKITLRGENKQITSLRLKYGEGIAGWVVTHNKPAVSNNPRRDRRFNAKIDEAIGFDTQKVLCVPLVVQGQPIGALEVLNKRSGNFSEDDQELLVSMAASLGVALKNAHLYEDVRARAQRNEIISQITTAINAGHGLSEIGKFIFEQLNRVIVFDHISLSLLDDTKHNLQQWLLTEHGSFEYSRSLIPLPNSALEDIIKTNEIQVYPDISLPKNGNVSYPDDYILLEDGIRSKMALPLKTKKSPYGSLNLGRRQAEAYGPIERQLLEAFLPQISVAIEKRRIIDAM